VGFIGKAIILCVDREGCGHNCIKTKILEYDIQDTWDNKRRVEEE
jgi:hypothetical protein